MTFADRSESIPFAVFFTPAFCVLFFAILEGWKLIAEVNASLPAGERFRYWGRDPVRAWYQHETVFPGRSPLRRRIRILYRVSFALLAAALFLYVRWR